MKNRILLLAVCSLSMVACKNRSFNESEVDSTSAPSAWPSNWEVVPWANLKAATNCQNITSPVPTAEQVTRNQKLRAERAKSLQEMANLETLVPIQPNEDFMVWLNRFEKAKPAEAGRWNQLNRWVHELKNDITKIPQPIESRRATCAQLVAALSKIPEPAQRTVDALNMRYALKFALDGFMGTTRAQPPESKPQPPAPKSQGPSLVCTYGEVVMMNAFGGDFVAEWFYARSRSSSSADQAAALRQAEQQCFAAQRQKTGMGSETYCKSYGCQ